MLPYEISPEVRRLVHLVVKSMIEKTKSDLKISIRFRQAYEEACKKDINNNNKYDPSHLQVRHHVRDILLKNGYIFVSPDDPEDVFITKKAIDLCELISDK
jgi:uncharacterized protein YijF (DUF1287 family)